ncbi:MAG: glutamate 5-kinase [Vampirovibrio sp.]
MSSPSSFPPTIEATLAVAASYVIKLGSQVIVDEAGRLALDRLAAYVTEIADAHHRGKRMAIVSSGAVALGKHPLAIAHETALSPEDKQVSASVGQPIMMAMYRQLFQHYGIEVAQVLVNPSDFSDRLRYKRLKTLMTRLLDHRIIPIINENDAIPDLQCLDEEWASSRVSPFSDNDKLAALISVQLEADVLLILSNVAGVYTANPFEDENAQRLTYIDDLNALQQIQTKGQTTLGRGGMASKIQAAELACRSGTSVIIASGLKPHAILEVLNFQGANAVFPATFIKRLPLDNTLYKRWIGLASGYNGVVVINQGASHALTQTGASLLAVGVVDVLGQFYAGDVVAVHVEGSIEAVARGIVQYNASELKQVKGLQSDVLMAQFGRTASTVEVIHRNHLVLKLNEVI